MGLLSFVCALLNLVAWDGQLACFFSVCVQINGKKKVRKSSQDWTTVIIWKHDENCVFGCLHDLSSKHDY